MPHPVTKPEILAALESNAATITELFAAVPDARLLAGDCDHWSPAHHLVHLTRTSLAIQRGVRSGSLPAHTTARSRTYAEVRDAAAGTLTAAPKERMLEMGRVVVVEPDSRREDLVSAFVAASAELRSAADGCDEQALDRHAMKHPLLGELTVREMLFFCVFHERHHAKSVRALLERVSGSARA